MVEAKRKYRLGLALSGGGAKGFAHIGAFRLLEECRLKPDIIAGTSAGAVAGALFADGYEAAKICEIFTGRDFSEFARLKIPKDGLLDMDRFRKFLQRHLRAKVFEDLKIPLAVVATDLDNGRSHAFRSGPIVDAVVASCSIPVIFSPVEINGVHYVDGGLFRNFPVSTIREECEWVIGVNVSPLIPHKYKQTILGVAERSYHYLFRSNTVEDRRKCDILIETEDIGGYKTFDLDNVGVIAEVGYEASVKAFRKAMREQRGTQAGRELLPHFTQGTTSNKSEMKKTIIYQAFPRLFGNRNAKLVAGGSLAANGAGKFADFTAEVLQSIKSLGVTHIWYAGIIEHATCSDYSSIGISRDHSAVVKGKAGSPYAVKDYYDVDPDLALDPVNRMKEFEELLERTHNAGMKAIIDFVPNHVARQYASDARFAYVEDLGRHDDVSLAFSADNNFYYIPGSPLALGVSQCEEDFEYGEFPAKATGNDLFTPNPGPNDWYETVKLNYGVDYMNAGATHFYPIPNTWKKMLDILRFWAGKGVDGFRCDMADMVPSEFWEWAVPALKKEYHSLFIAEIYNPSQYRNYLENGHFDYLYDKVGLYDTLRAVICRKAPASAITKAWQAVDGIQSRMLSFLENHDEQRIASTFFAGNPQAGIPGMITAALMNVNPVMIYNGQELGEQGMDAEGFSGLDGRTSIFDYWSMTSVRQWLEGELPANRQSLRETYACLLNITLNEPAVTQGAFHDLMYANEGKSGFDSNSVYAFLRKHGQEVILVAANFDNAEQTADIRIPDGAFADMNIPDNAVARAIDLFAGNSFIASLTSVSPFRVTLPPLSGKVIKFVYI
jgi:predicted acylesterase/phospholipase RssA/glycosidase